MNAPNLAPAARRLLAAVLLGSPALSASACAGTGQPEVTYAAHAEADVPGEIAAGAWTIALDEATVAFGPAYFCAADSGASTLCETAIAELTTITRVNLLDPTPQPLGQVHGFEGEIRSVSFNYGIHWFSTESSPAPAPEAPGVSSVHLRGRATRGAEALDFEADVDAVPQRQGLLAVPSLAVAARVGAAPVRLVVRFDVVDEWLASVDFDALAEGGATSVAIAPGSPAHQRLRYDMIAVHRPQFLWSTSP
ncbi:hypothetical protein [Sorangium sp. So ce363]|uniref:hypothetical protein n=1 Tax=Sorangium sp. So ce363 TaxID=3133304 RepID=UPI003F626DEC